MAQLSTVIVENLTTKTQKHTNEYSLNKLWSKFKCQYRQIILYLVLARYLKFWRQNLVKFLRWPHTVPGDQKSLVDITTCSCTVHLLNFHYHVTVYYSISNNNSVSHFNHRRHYSVIETIFGELNCSRLFLLNLGLNLKTKDLSLLAYGDYKKQAVCVGCVICTLYLLDF